MSLSVLSYAAGLSALRIWRLYPCATNSKRHQVSPAPERTTHPTTWHAFLARHCDHVLACGFFGVETATVRTRYVLFFIELGSRRVHLAGCTAHPMAAWVTQQARHVCWSMQDRTPLHRVLTTYIAHFRYRQDYLAASAEDALA